MAAAEQGEGEDDDDGGDGGSGDGGDGGDDGDGDGFVVRVESASDAWRPVAVRPRSLACAGLDCGAYHTLARTRDGRVWQWGDVAPAQRSAPPHRVEGLARIAQVATLTLRSNRNPSPSPNPNRNPSPSPNP